MSANTIKYRDRYVRRAARILPIIHPGKPVTPEAIDKIVGGSYSSKFVFYLRELGFEFSQQKDGRKIVSYTLIKEPADAASIRASAPTKTRAAKGATKVAKVLGLTKTEAKAIRAEVAAEKVTDVKAKNLDTIKKVAAKFQSAKKPKASKSKKVREFDDVTEQFGNNGEIATSFSIDKDWDSVDNLDLSKLL
jgi:hypothetical protein